MDFSYLSEADHLNDDFAAISDVRLKDDQRRDPLRHVIEGLDAFQNVR
jgi:hypothetical protein